MRRYANGVTLIVIIGIFFILLHFLVPLPTLAAISDNFNKIAIGIAALVTAYFGGSYFRDELYRKRAINTFRRVYPQEQHGHTFKLIESLKTPGAVFLLDLKTKRKHHIWNMKTMYDLGWQEFLPAESMNDSKFQEITTGNPIRTRGELGE